MYTTAKCYANSAKRRTINSVSAEVAPILKLIKPQMSCADVGRVLNLSEQRVLILQNQALRKVARAMRTFKAQDELGI